MVSIGCGFGLLGNEVCIFAGVYAFGKLNRNRAERRLSDAVEDAKKLDPSEKLESLGDEKLDIMASLRKMQRHLSEAIRDAFRSGVAQPDVEAARQELLKLRAREEYMLALRDSRDFLLGRAEKPHLAHTACTRAQTLGIDSVELSRVLALERELANRQEKRGEARPEVGNNRWSLY